VYFTYRLHNSDLPPPLIRNTGFCGFSTFLLSKLLVCFPPPTLTKNSCAPPPFLPVNICQHRAGLLCFFHPIRFVGVFPLSATIVSLIFLPWSPPTHPPTVLGVFVIINSGFRFLRVIINLIKFGPGPPGPPPFMLSPYKVFPSFNNLLGFPAIHFFSHPLQKISSPFFMSPTVGRSRPILFRPSSPGVVFFFLVPTAGALPSLPPFFFPASSPFVQVKMVFAPFECYVIPKGFLPHFNCPVFFTLFFFGLSKRSIHWPLPPPNKQGHVPPRREHLPASSFMTPFLYFRFHEL